MPSAESERAAFRARVAELRERAPGIVVDDSETARRLPLPGPNFGVRVTSTEIALGAEGGIVTWSDDELDGRIADTDPMELGYLLAAADPEALVPLDERGYIPDEEKLGGHGGFLVTRLHRALESEPSLDDSDAATLALAPSIPFRTVAEVVYTLGQVGVSNLDFLVRSGGEVRAQRIVLPSLEESVLAGTVGEHPPTPTSITIVARGAVVSQAGGMYMPGCESLRASGSRLTIESGTPALDATELGACLGAVRRGPVDLNTLILTADAEVPFEHVLRAAIVAGEFFETIQLSAGIR